MENSTTITSFHLAAFTPMRVAFCTAFRTNHLAQSRADASRCPTFAKFRDRRPVSMKNRGSHAHSVRRFHRTCGPASLQQWSELARAHDRARLAGLGILAAQPDDVLRHVGPGKRCDLALPHSGQIGKQRKVFQLFGKEAENSIELLAREKSLPH